MNAHATVGGQALTAPHSTGSAPPSFALPLGATDCHHHILDPKYSPAHGASAIVATVDDYDIFKRRLGLSRSVVIAPSTHGADNTCLLNALERFGDVARGVAIVTNAVTTGELRELHRRGVRGIRLYLGKGTPPTADEVRAHAARIADLGWHIQIVAARHAPLLAPVEVLLGSLPCTVVVDHLGYVPQPAGNQHSEAEVLRRLVDTGRVWVKLSGVYIRSMVGYPTYSDVDELASALVKYAPDKMLWGTDWPHPAAEPVKPDGAKLIEQLARWAPDQNVRDCILVDNPQQVYWYD